MEKDILRQELQNYVLYFASDEEERESMFIHIEEYLKDYEE